MTAKNVLYAAVGAPVVAARKVGQAVNELRSSMNKEADTMGKTANKRVAVWADEGEKLVNKITDAKMVDELTSKVDFEQVSTQVSKLRDQLEDMLATWRASFRPEKLPTVKVEASPEGVKLETKRSNGRKTVAKKPATRKAASQKAVAKKASARAKKSPATSVAAKSVAAKSAAAKSAAGKSVAARRSATAKVTSKAPSAKKASARKASSGKSAAKKATSTARKSVSVAS